MANPLQSRHRQVAEGAHSAVVEFVLEIRLAWLTDRLTKARAKDDQEAVRVCEEMIAGSTIEALRSSSALIELVQAIEELTLADFNAAIGRDRKAVLAAKRRA